MAALITVDQANDHLRLDLQGTGSPPDYSGDIRYAEVVRKMEEATDIVLDYIASSVARLETPWTNTTVPARVRAAILLTLSWLWERRGDDETDMVAANGYITQPVTALLHRLRDPVLA